MSIYCLNGFFELKKKPSLSKKTEEYLLKVYQPDIKNLERLIEKDLSHWYEGKA